MVAVCPCRERTPALWAAPDGGQGRREEGVWRWRPRARAAGATRPEDGEEAGRRRRAPALHERPGRGESPCNRPRRQRKGQGRCGPISTTGLAGKGSPGGEASKEKQAGARRRVGRPRPGRQKACARRGRLRAGCGAVGPAGGLSSPWGWGPCAGTRGPGRAPPWVGRATEGLTEPPGLGHQQDQAGDNRTPGTHVTHSTEGPEEEETASNC